METINPTKNPHVFHCNKCNFNSSNKKDYYRHTLTSKHNTETVETQKNPEKPLLNVCNCGKEYTSRSGLWKHKQKCGILHNTNEHINENPSIIDILSQNKELLNLLITKNHQTDELIQQNREMQNTILELVPKIGNNNNNNNNNTTNNNNNQFNLQVFLNEDCKDAINFS